MTERARVRLSATWAEIEILHDDDAILAFNKPAGLLVAPDRWNKKREHLVGLLQTAIRTCQHWVTARGIVQLSNAHRLDAPTSGVILFARTREALVDLVDQFHNRHPSKVYIALTLGAFPEGETVVDQPIAPSSAFPGRSIISASGKPALTRFTVLERFKGYTLVRAVPETGRLHQIRVHLQSIHCSLVGDPQYGPGTPLLLSNIKRDYRMKPEGEKPLVGRPALHAESIAIQHPVTRESVTITAPWPKDLTIGVKYLRKFAPA